MIRDSRIRHLLGSGHPLLLVMIGPAGAGKTSWHKRNVSDLTMVSLDTCRKIVSPHHDEADQAPETTKRAVELAFGTAGTLLAADRSVLWDATNCEATARKLLLDLAADHNAVPAAAVILPTLATCLERNSSRDAVPGPCGFARRVPDEVIAAMHAALTADVDALPAEGWDPVLVVDRSGIPGGGA